MCALLSVYKHTDYLLHEKYENIFNGISDISTDILIFANYYYYLFITPAPRFRESVAHLCVYKQLDWFLHGTYENIFNGISMYQTY